MAEQNSGRPRTNLVKAVGAGLEPVASGLQVQRSYHSATRALERLSDIGEMPNKRNAKSVAVDAFTGSLFFTITIFHLAYPQKFCRRSIVFKFSRKDCKSQEKVETMLTQNVFFGGGGVGGWGGGGEAIKVYYGNLKVANFLYLTSKNIYNTTR